MDNAALLRAVSDALAILGERYPEPAIALPFEDMAAGLLALSHRDDALRDYKDIALRLDAIEVERLGLCERLELANVNLAIELATARYLLAGMLHPDAASKSSNRQIRELAHGDALYDYLLLVWLGERIDKNWLFDLGVSELEAAVADHVKLEAQLGLTDRPEALRTHLTDPRFDAASPDALVKEYADHAENVAGRQAALFRAYPEVSPAKLLPDASASDLQVDAYYDLESGTFYFRSMGDHLSLLQTDYLFLHEAVPGHHFYFEVQKHYQACPEIYRDPRVFSIIEGWATYVELLGADLGLYATPERELAAVQWRIVRAARVALDIGINHRGWSRKEAQQFWNKNTRGVSRFADREIDRVTRWPAQAITYVYGAARIREAREQSKQLQGESFDVRVFHDALLRLGDVPPAVLSEMLIAAIQAEQTLTFGRR